MDIEPIAMSSKVTKANNDAFQNDDVPSTCKPLEWPKEMKSSAHTNKGRSYLSKSIKISKTFHNIEPFEEDIHIISSDLDIIKELKERQRAEVFSANIFNRPGCTPPFGYVNNFFTKRTVPQF